MIINRRTLVRCLAVAAVFVILPTAIAAETPRYLQPVKRHPGAGYDPVATAQVQIVRLRQTADQLRLLVRQPQPLNAGTGVQLEYRRNGTWLLEAEYRISNLADQWEQRVRPQNGVTANGDDHARHVRVNELFIAQVDTLQARLRQESLELDLTSQPIRASSETARIIIEYMR